MKLWKTLKLPGTNRTGSETKAAAASSTSSNLTVDTFELEDLQQRAVSESPDSGLPGDRTARRITIQLDRRYGKDLGFILAGRSEPGLLPTIAGFTKDSAAQDTDRFAPGDRICSINGIATARLTNDEVLALLDNVEERASLEVEYYLPNYDSQNSLCITTKVTQVSVEKANGSLGMTLRGGELSRSNSEDSTRSYGLGGMRSSGPLIITHVRSGGPAHTTARIKPGDRLIKVDNISLSNKTLTETYQLLQNSPPITNLTIEYDISVMESVKFATGPLLVEIERGNNENLGIILTNKYYDEYYGGSTSSQYADGLTGIFIESIIPASISDRCGALHPGDQLLAVNDFMIENMSYTPEEVMNYIESYSGKGFTQLQIYPMHMIAKTYRTYKSRGKQPGSPISGVSTMSSRKSHKQNKQMRQSSLPKTYEIDSEFIHNNFVTGVGVCRSEVLSLQLDIPPNHDSGITVCEDRELLLISHITHQSPAYRSGCLQLGDRILSINSHQNLTAQAVNEILQKRNDANSMRCLNIKVEFNMADNIEASSGIFNVKLAKNGAGLGVTITGNKQHGSNSEEPMIISNIKIGSVAYRNGTLAVGDQLIAIDSQPLSNLSLDAAFNILQNFPDDIITLTIRKSDKLNNWIDLHGMSLCANHPYNAMDTSSSINSSIKSSMTYTPVVQSIRANYSVDTQDDETNSKKIDDGFYILDIELIKQCNETLGLTIAGSEDANQSIVISGLVKGGVAERSGSVQVGDHILFINKENVQNKPLSEAINILQNSQNKVFLKILRNLKHDSSSKAQAEGEAFENRDSNKFAAKPQTSPGLMSIDSAVESWDSQPVKYTSNEAGNRQHVEPHVEAISIDSRISYLPTDENKLLASGFKISESKQISDELPMPNYNFTNTLRTFKSDAISNMNAFLELNEAKKKYDERNKIDNTNLDMINNSDEIETFCANNSSYIKSPSGVKSGNNQNLHLDSLFPKSHMNNRLDDEANHNENNRQMTTRRQYNGQKNCLNFDNYQLSTNNYQIDTQNYDSDILGFYNVESPSNKGTIHLVTLYKDVIYDDYGFSVSDGLYERGVYINRIRKGGPADIVGLLRPYDRILQVNGTRTVDFDCCLTVPLIASAGDRIELVLQRLKDTNSWSEDNNSNILDGSNIVTKTI